MIKLELVEDLQRELILGTKSQYLVTNKGFYAVFEANKGFKVMNKGKTIGELDPPAFGKPSDYVGENIFLAAQIWKIVGVDDKKNKYFVEKARDGKPPMFLDNGGREIHPKIREKMLEMVLNQDKFDYLDEKSQIELQDLRNQFLQSKNLNIQTQRPVVEEYGKTSLFLFIETKTQQTIERVITDFKKDLLINPKENPVSLTFKLDKKDTLKFWTKLVKTQTNFHKLAEKILDQDSDKNRLTKYAKYLPLNLQVQFYADSAFDDSAYKEFIVNMKFTT